MASRDFAIDVYVPKSPADRKIENGKKDTKSNEKSNVIAKCKYIEAM